MEAVKKKEAFEGQLRVWWVPQVPMDPFTMLVKSIPHAVLLLDALARYDLFQLEKRIKPDYSNAGGLEVFEGGEWVSWEVDGFDNPREYLDYLAENGLLEEQL